MVTSRLSMSLSPFHVFFLHPSFPCFHLFDPVHHLTRIPNSLFYQCSSNGHGSVCEALANVYYTAVRAFGRQKGELQQEYDLLLAYYNELVAEAIDKGEDPLFY